jgi:hypothetical protein
MLKKQKKKKQEPAQLLELKKPVIEPDLFDFLLTPTP